MSWIVFIIFVIFLLVLDLGIIRREDQSVTVPSAIIWSIFYVSLALVFNLLIYFGYEHHWLGLGKTIGLELDGGKAALQFLTAYLVEKSLSLDNIFVIALIFTNFKIPLKYQHRVLFWGILGAFLMRGVMIAVGVSLIRHFSWVNYIFGGFLFFTAIKILIARHDNVDPQTTWLVRITKKFLPFSDQIKSRKFSQKIDGKTVFTPLFLVLIVVEGTDFLFAVDSIPAVLAVTSDPFLVFSSNAFAILGLRSLYFALAGLMHRFRYLKMSLVFLLVYVGVKMILTPHHQIPNAVSLAVISGILMVGLIGSMVGSEQDTAQLISPIVDELENLAQVSIRQARRISIAIAGTTILFIGIITLALPGPGLLIIITGLSILGMEFAWAKSWIRKIQARVRYAKKKVQDFWEE